jgi:PAS domain S-box-containing protein
VLSLVKSGLHSILYSQPDYYSWRASDILSYFVSYPDVSRQKAKTAKYPSGSELAVRCNELEQALAEANRKLYLTLESIQDGFIILDRNWTLSFVNRSAADGFGLDPKDLVGKNLWERFPKYAGTIFEKNLRESMANKKSACFEWDGLYNAVNTWEISVFPADDDLVIIWRDITDRKRLEETLRLNVERFSKAFNYCQAALFISRIADGFFLDANEAFLLTFGFSRDEVIGNTAFGLNIYPDPSKRAEFARILQTQGAIRNLEVPMQTKTGRPLTLIASVDRIILNGQDFTLGTFTDITERKKDEEMHKDSEDRLKTAQRMAHIGNWEFHVEENKALWSEELFHIFNLKPEKYGPDLTAYMNYIHPDDAQRAAEVMNPFMFEGKLGDTAVFDYRVVLGDGSVRDLHTERTIVEVDMYGKPAKIMGIEQDITERKKIEQQLELYRRNLEQLVEERTKQLKDSERLAAIGQTAGMVGHDIRNPLQAIMSSMYLVKDDLEALADSEEKTDALLELTAIGEQVNYMDKIIADLQNYARAIKPEYLEVDMSELIISVFQTVNLPDEIGLKVDVKGLPKIRTDPTLIRRALTNLVNNALQAMPDGGNLTIRTYQDKETNSLVIDVEDTGVGIPKETQEKLFTPLFTTKSRGQGFGLAVVKRITDALGGKISFESQEGKGTKFSIELPAK